MELLSNSLVIRNLVIKNSTWFGFRAGIKGLILYRENISPLVYSIKNKLYYLFV